MDNPKFTTVLEMGLRDKILDLFYNRVAVVNYGGEEFLSSGANLNEDGSVYMHLASMALHRPTFPISIPAQNIDKADVRNDLLFVMPSEGPQMQIKFLSSGTESLSDLVPSEDDAERLSDYQRKFIDLLLEKDPDTVARLVLHEEHCKMFNRVLSSDRVTAYVDSLPHPQKMDAGQIIMNFSIYADYNRDWDMSSKDFKEFRELLLNPLFGTK